MQLTFTAWLESLDARVSGQGETYRSCQKHDSVSQHDLLPTGPHL